MVVTYEQAVQYEKHGGVAHVWLNRPEVLNAYNTVMRDHLHETLGAIADDDEVAAVLVRGRGRSFCAGADLTEFGTSPSQAVARQVRWQRDVWRRLVELPIPVICAIHGHCIGSGVEIALLCDLRLASADATFAMPEVRLGMIPAAGGTQTLPRSIGLASSLDLLLTGKRIDASQAQRVGLVNRVLPSWEALETESESLACNLSAQKSWAATVKRSVREGAGLTLEDALGVELRLAAQAQVSAISTRTQLGGPD